MLGTSNVESSDTYARLSLCGWAGNQQRVSRAIVSDKEELRCTTQSQFETGFCVEVVFMEQ